MSDDGRLSAARKRELAAIILDAAKKAAATARNCAFSAAGMA